MRSRSDRTRRALTGLAAGLAMAALLAACGASSAVSPASAGSAAVAPGAASVGTTDTVKAASAEGGVAPVAVPPAALPTPAVDPVTGTGGSSTGSAGATGSGTASTGTAIAYPYYGGTPGVAPDHTIVVSGYGQASMAADGSNRAKAQAKALEAALADARSQADVIARATGVTITGVLSVGAAGSSGYAVPMAVNGSSGTVDSPPAVTPSDPGQAPVPAASAGAIDFGVSVTVAYSIGS